MKRQTKMISLVLSVTTAVAAFAANPTVKLKTTWHTGYVGSDTNAGGNKNIICTTDTVYAYTDVIELPAAGMKVMFVDPANGVTSDNAYCVSNWRRHKGEEEICLGLPRYKGMPGFIVTKGADGTTYTYTSSGPERIRFCYRANGTHVKNPPVVTLTRTMDPKNKSAVNTGTWFVRNKAAVEANDAWVAKDKARAYYKALEGKTVYFLGDSYLDGNGLSHEFVWPTLLQKKYNLQIDNHGRNGAAVCAFNPDRNPMLFFWKELGNSLADGKRGAPAPDVIVFEGGRNDFNVKAPIGDNNSTDTKTVKGAIRTIYTELHKKWPKAVIIGMTAWRTDQGNCNDYARAMKEMCAALAIPCIDGTDPAESGIRMFDQGWRARYAMNQWDASHFNEAGMKVAFPYFEKIIGEALGKWK